MKLTIETLCSEADKFADLESPHPEPSLFGVTDGKAVGTYLEHKFRAFLRGRGYQFEEGNSANAIDFPSLLVDMKVISTDHSQSPCPFKSVRQKMYGLGYSLIIFVCDKTDDEVTRTANLTIANTIFFAAERTADFKVTKGIRNILENEGNQDDVVAFLSDSYLLQDEEQLDSLAKELLKYKPEQGYLNMPRQPDCFYGLTSNRLIVGMPL